jgi:hypothetical protein
MDNKWWTLIVVCAGSLMLLLDAYALTLAALLLTSGVTAVWRLARGERSPASPADRRVHPDRHHLAGRGIPVAAPGAAGLDRFRAAHRGTGELRVRADPGRETSWSHTGVLACLAGGAVLLAAFIVAEGRVKNPMFDRSLLRVPSFTGVSIAAFAMNGSLNAMLLYCPASTHPTVATARPPAPGSR